MNLIDAIKSGRRMRRMGEFEFFEKEVIVECLRLQSLLADDWEVEVEPEKKPRLLAYVCDDERSRDHRRVAMFDFEPMGAGTYWKRMPHLDEPEVK